jgi:hypothetical protein
VRPLSPVRGTPAGAAVARLGRDTSARVVFPFTRRDRLPRGRPPLLAVRWPHATGLTSYLSSCLALPSNDAVFNAVRAQEGSHALPGASLPRELCFFSRPHLRSGALWRGRPADADLTCWLAVANWDHGWSLPFLRRSKLPADSHWVSKRFLIAANFHIPCSHCTGCVRPQAVRMGEFMPQTAS